MLTTTCYHLPEWYGTVVVRAYERDSIRTCGTGALTAEGKRRITREPYLQSTTTLGTIVAWGSNDAGITATLRTPHGSEPLQSIPATPAAPPRRGEIRVFKAAFNNLEPNSLYCYQLVGPDGVALTEAAPVTTAPRPGLSAPFRFVAVGDSGMGNDAQKAITQRMLGVPFDLMLFLGDIAYNSGTPSQLQNKFFEIYDSVLRYVPAYPSIGNHERRTEEGRPYFDAFVLPGAERYYSFDWGDVHFVAIDTTHRDSEQLAWLVDDLAATKQRWKIVFGHHPMYTNSLRGPQKGIRQAYAKIFTDAKVDVVITGHEHHYERFRVGGVNYIVSGGGGARLTRFFGMSRSLERATVHHFLHFEVTATALTMKVVDIDGDIVETLKLTKSAPAEAPKATVDEKPEPIQNAVPPEQKTVPDEKLYDEPSGDAHNPI